MLEILETLGSIGIIPMIKIHDPEKAAPLAKAILAGGIPVAEVTFRTPQAADSLRRIAQEVPAMLLGAGTVLSTDQVDQAIDGGARFIVSPGFNPKVVSHCIAKGIPVIPGCSSPSDMEQALEQGLEAVKFFPAEQSGGLDYIKALSGPYPGLKFIPTGGINGENIPKYIAFDKVLACGGSWMLNHELIQAGKFDEITDSCRKAMLDLLGFSVAHLGFIEDTAVTASKAAYFFKTAFGFYNRDMGISIFAGDNIEIMKYIGKGTHGHIGIGTNSIVRAVAYLERRGIRFNEESMKQDDNGNMTLIYLIDEISGFAIHLVQRK